MGLLDKIKGKTQSSFGGSSSSASSAFPAAPEPVPLGPDSVFRYRKQRGVNLGSWFVLEQWITPGPFQNAKEPKKSDKDIAMGDNAKAAFEQHWDTFITADDWNWMKEHGFNSVRLPIGYYHLASACPDVLKDTEFEPFAETFSGAWDRIERAIQTAGQHGIGVLIDLHCAAGCQNPDDHSGTSNGKARLFDKSSNLRSTSLALQFLASHFASTPHVVGLELLNEPERGNMKLQSWYEKTIKEVQAVAGAHFPIYIHDSWDTPHYAQWLNKRNDFVVLDHHLYRCFGGPDSNADGEGQARNLRENFAGQFNWLSDQSKGNLVVGEWSGALKWELISHLPGPERDRQHREFVKAQLELFNKFTGGFWFWTLKKGEGWDSGWSAMNEVQAEILPKWIGSGQFRGQPPSEAKNQALKQAHDAHTGYWQSHGGSPNSAVFAPGFAQGWDDALIFFGHPSDVSEMGFSDPWMQRRKEEYEKGNSALGKAAWEWEHGFEQGLEACKAACIG